MRNLIYVNMMRLKKSRIFRVGVIASMVYAAFLLFMNYREMADSPETVINYINWYFLSTLPVASAFCSVFSGMFLGTEYSDGTIRNKLMVGHTRKEIYCANLIVVFFANVFVYLAGCLVVAVAGIPMFGWNIADSPVLLVFRMLNGILMLGGYAGIFTLLSMLIDSKAVSAAGCMIFYAILFIGSPFLQTAVYSYYGKVPWNHVPDKSIQPLLEFLYDFLPSGQEIQISGAIILHPYRLPVYSVICIAVTTVCGMAVFAKKDLK